MSKILFISNISKKVGSFALASIEAAHNCGLDFLYASNWFEASYEQRKADEEEYGLKICNIDLARSPVSKQNLLAYKQLTKLINDESVEYIHCNTPTGGLLGRLAGRKCRVMRVIYHAHGFHFYKGAPLINWFVYYSIERWLARYTDVIITINREDYNIAQKFHLREGGNVYHIPGVGIDTKDFIASNIDRDSIRKSLGFTRTDIICISMGDLIKRKNYAISINAIAKCKENVYYIICGVGPEDMKLKKLVQRLNIGHRVHFVGFRKDIKELLASADIFLLSSLQEGLPRSTMEAMASGLPCVVSNIRGNVDLIEDGVGGYLCSPQDSTEFASKISELSVNIALREKIQKNNLNTIKEFDVSVVKGKITKIYSEILREKNHNKV